MKLPGNTLIPCRNQINPKSASKAPKMFNATLMLVLYYGGLPMDRLALFMQIPPCICDMLSYSGSNDASRADSRRVPALPGVEVAAFLLDGQIPRLLPIIIQVAVPGPA